MVFRRKSTMFNNFADASGGAVYNSGKCVFETSAAFQGNRAKVLLQLQLYVCRRVMVDGPSFLEKRVFPIFNKAGFPGQSTYAYPCCLAFQTIAVNSVFCSKIATFIGGIYGLFHIFKNLILFPGDISTFWRRPIEGSRHWGGARV